jgi:hypothetical protein
MVGAKWGELRMAKQISMSYGGNGVVVGRGKSYGGNDCILTSGNLEVAKVHDALSEAKLLQGSPVASRAVLHHSITS